MRWRAACGHKAVPSLHPSAVHESHLHPARHTSFPSCRGMVQWAGKKTTKNPCEAVRNEAPVNTASTRRRPFVYPPGGGWLVFTKRVNSEHRVSGGGSENGCLRDDPGCSRATRNRGNVKCMLCACCRGVNEELALSHQR